MQAFYALDTLITLDILQHGPPSLPTSCSNFTWMQIPGTCPRDLGFCDTPLNKTLWFPRNLVQKLGQGSWRKPVNTCGLNLRWPENTNMQEGMTEK